MHNLQVVIPVPGEAPAIASAVGETTYDKRNGVLAWTVGLVDASNASGSIEFTTAAAGSADAFFPIQVGFGAPRPLCDIEVPEVLDAESQQPVPFAKLVHLTVESFTVD